MGASVGAEQIIEATAYGNVRGRIGNRSPDAAPQGVYRTADPDFRGELDRWVAISVADDRQWQALCQAVGMAAWASDDGLRDHAGRQARHDELDAGLAKWCAQHPTDEIVKLLVDAGVPVGDVRMPMRPWTSSNSRHGASSSTYITRWSAGFQCRDTRCGSAPWAIGRPVQPQCWENTITRY